jgi:hypothetical protein
VTKYRKYILLIIGILVLPLVLIVRGLVEQGGYSTGNLIGHIGLLLFGIFLLYHHLRKEKRGRNRVKVRDIDKSIS